MDAVSHHPLTACTSIEEQAQWVEAALAAGKTVSDTALWVGGVDRPGELISRLRSKGLAIETTRKQATDADGAVHSVLAWRLAA